MGLAWWSRWRSTPIRTVSRQPGQFQRRQQLCRLTLSQTSQYCYISDNEAKMSLFGDVVGFLGAGRAAGAIGNANIAGEHGVLNATQGATTGIESQLGKAYNDVGQAGANVN